MQLVNYINRAFQKTKSQNFWQTENIIRDLTLVDITRKNNLDEPLRWRLTNPRKSEIL